VLDWVIAIQGSIRQIVEEKHRTDLHRWPILMSFECTAYEATDTHWLFVIKDHGPTSAIPSVNSGDFPTPWPDDAPEIRRNASIPELAAVWSDLREAFGLTGRDATIFIRVTEATDTQTEWSDLWTPEDQNFYLWQAEMTVEAQRSWLYGFDRQDGFMLPTGYQFLTEQCQSFFVDHPNYDRNVFLMTSFDISSKPLVDLDVELRRVIRKIGLNPVRADDKMYLPDRNLWNNVCLYMLCCGQGIAILEDRARDEFNPNIALEYGFMRGLSKPALLLADKGFRNLRADVFGTLREEFDLLDLIGTVGPAVQRWAASLNL
jgi:hypothetical protein